MLRQLKRPCRILALILLLAVRPASAVELFLDVNGDGRQTIADVVHPVGSTSAVLWLVRDRFPHGHSDECSHGWTDDDDHPYSMVLRAEDGLVAWEMFQPSPPHGQGNRIEFADSTIVVLRGAIPRGFPSASMRLVGIRIRVLGGRPSIHFVAQRSERSNQASRFSTGTWEGPVEACGAPLPYGGPPNRKPRLIPLAPEIPVRAGSREPLPVEATDEDGDPLTFRMIYGPAFVTVRTLDRGRGVARGAIQVGPDSCSGGTWDCIVEVSDGFRTDQDTTRLRVVSLERPMPTSPLLLALEKSPTPEPNPSPSDSTWIVGEWEWIGTRGGRWRSDLRRRDFRRRLVLRSKGRMSLYDIAEGRVTQAFDGNYRSEAIGGGRRIMFSKWPTWRGLGSGVSFEMEFGMNWFTLYPSGTSDASTDHYVRVPSVASNGAPIDTSRLVTPIDPPIVRGLSPDSRLILSETMRAAVARCDPEFVEWNDRDRVRLSETVRGPSHITGDFDGDSLTDAAILGSSGADQVIMAVLSNFGAVVAQEVAWRKARIGTEEYKTRADPEEVVPLYLESVPRDTYNRYCWRVGPFDAIGVVQPGVARFDYVLSQGRFVLGTRFR